LPGTLAVAITYALKRWPALTRYCEDGRLEIDNLIAERALRGVAMGSRNGLFACSKAGGERAASIYTIIETCKLNGVEPFAYISSVMRLCSVTPISRCRPALGKPRRRRLHHRHRPTNAAVAHSVVPRRLEFRCTSHEIRDL
jgi:hypothetical protein